MKNRIIAIIIIGTILAHAQPKFEPTNSAPGSFARIGFMPRGIAMGNAVSAITTGEVSPFYNPALSVFQQDNAFHAGYTFLSLDRTLNYINFTRKFEFFSSKDSAIVNAQPRATAGLSAGVINSGISAIDGRDNQGFKTGELSTSENLFFVSVANKFSKKIAVGISVKVYYFNLYEEVTSTGVGFDLGMVYTINDNLKAAFVFTDVNAKYKWDTSNIYSTDGTTTNNKFPLAKKLAVSYFEASTKLQLAAEFDFNSYGRKLLRAGAEYEIYPMIVLRAGMDNFVLNNSDELIQLSAGFSFGKMLSSYKISLDYAFTPEPYSAGARHLLGLTFIF